MHFFYHPPTEWRRLCFQSCLCIILSTRGTHVTITHHELKEPHSTGPSLYRALPPLPCPLAPVQGNPPVLTSYSQHKSAVYILLECFLVSLNTHSVMQELASVRRFCVRNPQFTLFLTEFELQSRIPLPHPTPKLKLLMENFVSWNYVWRVPLCLPRIPSRFGGGL